MPDIPPAEPTISAIFKNALLYLKQRMDVLLHLQQSPSGPFVVQMQDPQASTANAFSQDRMGFRQDGSNFLVGALDRVAVSYAGSIVLQATDFTALVSAVSGQCAVYLPVANLVPGRIYQVKKTDSSGNAVKLTRQASDTIDGATTYSLAAQYNAAIVQSDGVKEWWVLAKN